MTDNVKMEEDSLVSRVVYARFLMQITTPEEAKIPQCSYQINIGTELEEVLDDTR